MGPDLLIYYTGYKKELNSNNLTTNRWLWDV